MGTKIKLPSGHGPDDFKRHDQIYHGLVSLLYPNKANMVGYVKLMSQMAGIIVFTVVTHTVNAMLFQVD